MRKITFVFSLLVLALTACDSSDGKSFYMTNNGEEITSVNCEMTDIKVRIDIASLENYSGGDLVIRFEMVDSQGNVGGEGTGDFYVASNDIPEDKLLWIDVNPSSSKVMNFATQMPFNILYFCNNGGGKSKIRITYFEPNDSGEHKIGYEDEILVNSF